MTLSELMPNEGKMDVMEVDGVAWLRLPIKTHVITEKDNIVDVVETYAKPYLKEGS